MNYRNDISTRELQCTTRNTIISICCVHVAAAADVRDRPPVLPDAEQMMWLLRFQWCVF